MMRGRQGEAKPLRRLAGSANWSRPTISLPPPPHSASGTRTKSPDQPPGHVPHTGRARIQEVAF